MNRSRFALILVVVLLLGLAGTAMILASMPPPVAGPAALASPPTLSAGDLRFYESVSPELRAAAGEARQLTTQGQERSRNLFAIRAGQDRLHGHLTALDTLLAEEGVPARFAPVAATYQAAAVDIRTSMRQAEAAFPRFDWDSVGAATELMAGGTAQLEGAVTRLDAAAGATPVAATGTPTP